MIQNSDAKWTYHSFRKAKECEDREAAFAEAMFFGEEFKESMPPETPRRCRHPSKKFPPPCPPSSLQLIQSRWNLSLAMHQDHLNRDKSVPQIGKRARRVLP
jgi:hypothetical protein